MEPGSVTILAVTILAIQNPGDTEATIFRSQLVLDPDAVIERYGNKIEQGAFVSLTDRDSGGNTANVQHFIVERAGDAIYLQNNAFMQDADAAEVDDIGTVIASGYAPLEVAEPEPELETFTVFGTNDDDEGFVAVVVGTEDTVRDLGIQAGVVDEGFEHDVHIAAILKGDHSEAERVTV